MVMHDWAILCLTVAYMCVCVQKSSSQPGSPSTPSALSSGIDHDFTLVDDSLKSFKLCEGVSSSSHSGDVLEAVIVSIPFVRYWCIVCMFCDTSSSIMPLSLVSYSPSLTADTKGC